MISDNNSNNANVEEYSSAGSDSEENDLREEDLSDNSVRPPTFALRMLYLSKEVAIFTLIVVTYAALTNDPPKVTKSPAAYPFFSKNSIIKDWYRGQISKGIELARSSDITFLMFYAPWSAESQHARTELEKAAQHMQKYVTFAAVNCWQPNGECKLQYNKVYKWPVLVAYPSHGRGIQYTGPLEAQYIIKFLQCVCHPIERKTEETITEYHDVYVTATLNASPGSADFAIYYLTALKYLEKEPTKSVKFYVTSSEVEQPEVRLHLWNVTLTFPIQTKDWNSDTLMQWIVDNISVVTSWMTPSGSKSAQLSKVLSHNPTLILFTPRNPLHFNIDYYDMLQLISREYYDCGDVYIHLDMFHIRTKRLINYMEYKKRLKRCSEFKDAFENFNVHVIANVWNNISCWHEDKLCQRTLVKSSTMKGKLKDELHYCRDMEENCFKMKYLRNKHKYPISMYTGYTDHRSAENLLAIHENESCRGFLLAEEFSPHIFEQDINMGNVQDVSGLACKVNHSLQFVAIDSLLHYQFAERLGIDLNKYKDKTAVVIVNEKMESHYIMHQSVSTEDLRKFIHNYTNNYLPRSYESIATIDSKITHTFENNLDYCRSWSDDYVCVQELSSKTFLPVVMSKKKAVLVFYYSKQCAFCSGASHAFLTAARKLSSVENILFTRIDGDINILPWQYTMESYPTIIYFPPVMKSESRVYPRNLPITVPNLIGFLLTHLSPSMKLHTLWSVCNNIQNSEERSTCLSNLRIETLSLIENTLYLWRRSNKRHKQIMLHKLRNLKQLHLLLAHKPSNVNYVNSFFNKLHVKPQTCTDYQYMQRVKLKDEL